MNKIVLCIIVVIAILLPGCCKTPPECVDYCVRIEAWATQCKKPKFSLESCKRTFMACTEAHESVKALECWQHMLQWSPEPQAEFNCATTTVPEL